MTDIPDLPEKKPPRHKGRITTSKQWIERGPLAPWMYAYLQWLAGQPEAVLVRRGAPPGYRRGPPATQVRTAKASRLACRKISHASIRALELRDDAVDYFQKLRADAQYLAKELLRQDIARNIEVRRAGLEQAVAEHDHKEIRQYSEWAIGLGFPKKEAREDAAPRITIHLGSKDAKALIGKVLDEEDEVQDVEYEVIEPKQLTDGEED